MGKSLQQKTRLSEFVSEDPLNIPPAKLLIQHLCLITLRLVTTLALLRGELLEVITGHSQPSQHVSYRAVSTQVDANFGHELQGPCEI